MSAARKLVVTGASTGFGRAIVEAALARGWSVLGTVRKDADAEALGALGVATARLDLAVPASIGPGCDAIAAWCGGALDALVNNAGSTWPGPVELVTMADLRMQFEVNTFGQVDVTQRLLPAIRAARGHVVFVSSDSTTTTPPILGPYAASKRALEALAEALAQETADQGLRVSIVAPGPYATAIWGTSTPRGEASRGSDDPRVALYRPLAEQLRAAAENWPQGDPADLARVVLDVVDDPRPPMRTVAPFSSRAAAWLRAAVGPRRFHRLIRREVARRAGG